MAGGTGKEVRKYEVIVGNIGTVYAGSDRTKALDTYREYVDQSSSRVGRAGGEEVNFLIDGNLEFWWDGEIGTTPADPPAPTADQYRVIKARETLASYGLEDDGIEAIDRLLANMGYELQESDG
jgi:hypothetical protein